MLLKFLLGQAYVPLGPSLAVLRLALRILHYTDTVWGSGQWGSFSVLPHRMAQWAVRLLQNNASLHRAVGSGDSSVYRLTAWGSGQRGLFSALLHCMGHWVVGVFWYTGVPFVKCLTACGSRQWDSFSTPPHCMRQWAVGFLLYTTIAWGSG